MGMVYLNGEFLPLEQATISPLDRGFIFGDGVYEVIPVYGGRLFRLEEHLLRLDGSLAGIRLASPHTHTEWARILHGLVERNQGGNQSVYLQITRGAAKRDHAFPRDCTPTVFAMSSPLAPLPAEIRQAGIAAITLPDIRWQYCHLKTIALLPNILLRQQALDSGAAEAILIRDGEATETWEATETDTILLDGGDGADHAWVVQATGSTDMSPVYPGSAVWALTAAIKTDVDGDGWDAPLPGPSSR